jgi:ABC-type phosphonate transport system ATPase subunit
MLVIKGLTRGYGTGAAVGDVSLDTDAGRFIGVIGRSGAGNVVQQGSKTAPMKKAISPEPSCGPSGPA